MVNVVTNLEKLNLEILDACKNSNRESNEIHIIAVTKYVTVERAKEALEAGIIHLGENREDGLHEKWTAIGNKSTWHFIGSLQTRKVKNIIEIVDYIHSLDRISLAKEIDKRASKTINCFVQVNVSGEDSKHGITPSEVLSFVENMKDYPNISIVGLMTMAPYTEDEQILRNCFATLKKLQQQIIDKSWDHAPCNELSMGMSNDFKIAIEEGATMIRIGTALVGES